MLINEVVIGLSGSIPVPALIDKSSATGIFPAGLSLYDVLAINMVGRYYFVNGVYHLDTSKDTFRIKISTKLVNAGVKVSRKDLPLYLHWSQKSKLFDEYLKGI